MTTRIHTSTYKALTKAKAIQEQIQQHPELTIEEFCKEHLGMSRQAYYKLMKLYEEKGHLLGNQ